MNKKRVLALLAATVMTVSLFAGCGGGEKKPEAGAPEKQETKLKVGLVTDEGGINDGSFNQSAHEGITKAEKDLGIEQVNPIESKQQLVQLLGCRLRIYDEASYDKCIKTNVR